MSLRPTDVEALLERNGFRRDHETKKVIAYRSLSSGNVLYFKREVGLPNYIRLVIHPYCAYSPLTALDGVEVGSEWHHSSNMTTFPKRLHEGADEIYFGRPLDVVSLDALEVFARAFHEMEAVDHPTSDDFDIGTSYTRDEIHARLGGSKQTYLPQKDGRVVCACLTPKMNPDSPAVILVGSGPQIRRAGDLLCKQAGSVPIFIKRGSNDWRYVGDYQVERCSDAPQDLELHAERSGRDNITRIIYLAHMKPAAPLAEDLVEPGRPDRVKQETSRIIRDTTLARSVKAENGYRCQICGETLELKDGKRYAEAHHLWPLGAPHNGPDVRGNIICVCPNHHALLDFGAMGLDVAQLDGVDSAYVDYHNEHIFGLRA